MFPRPARIRPTCLRLRVPGLRAVSLAGNHIAIWAPKGIADTVSALDAAGIAHAGAAGESREGSARRPFLSRAGRAIALLSYNCVGPESAWARRASVQVAPTCASKTLTAGRSRPRRASSELDEESLAAMSDDIAEARRKADVVVVALHKGIVHTPARLAPYERPIAHAAIEAGCRHRVRAPRAHRSRHRDLSRQAHFSWARQWLCRHARAESRTSRTPREPPGRVSVASSSASSRTPRTISRRFIRRRSTRCSAAFVCRQTADEPRGSCRCTSSRPAGPYWLTVK